MFRFSIFLFGILYSTACIDFSEYSAGDVLTDLGNGVRVEALKKPRKLNNDLILGQAMIFNSSMPTGGDLDLGSPNQAFGGPGVGSGGVMTSNFANKIAQGNVLIISEDEDSMDPDDNKNGGRLKFFFNPPRYIDSVGLLDPENVVRLRVFTADGGNTNIRNSARGNNSFERVYIGLPQVRKLTVVFKDSGAVTDIGCQITPECVADFAIDFETFTAGQSVTTLGYGIDVSATRHGSSGPESVQAMIFDSSYPSGDDLDLGTPHRSVGGPGKGVGGRIGAMFENVVSQGKILIISEDGDSSDPDDASSGGVLDFQFSTPTYVNDIGLLDNEEGAHVTIRMADDTVTTIEIPGRSNNAFEIVQIQLPTIVAMSVDFSGSAALTHINASTCP